MGGPISRLVTELLAEIKAEPNFINDLLAELFPGSITPSNAIGDSGVVKMGDAASASTGSGVHGAGAGTEGGGVQGSFSFHVSVSGADGGPPPPEFAELLRRILEAIGDAWNDDSQPALPGGADAANGTTNGGAAKKSSGKRKSSGKKKAASKPKSEATAAEL